MEIIDLNEYHGYSENRGIVECKNCQEELWTSIPENGTEIECHACNCEMIFVE